MGKIKEEREFGGLREYSSRRRKRWRKQRGYKEMTKDWEWGGGKWVNGMRKDRIGREMGK